MKPILFLLMKVTFLLIKWGTNGDIANTRSTWTCGWLKHWRKISEQFVSACCRSNRRMTEHFKRCEERNVNYSIDNSLRMY
jgi:hypothetical protein